uniref:Uncharacterized protein n=1 Tax=Physcomitrium patens TaxID=3218 RepID=A0A2K1J7Q1_PHYPA|nr:hypothetical protein PHYPA_020674 [Physcomitrium patens]
MAGLRKGNFISWTYWSWSDWGKFSRLISLTSINK